MNPMNDAYLPHMDFDLWCLFCIHLGFSPARSTYTCASFSLASLFAFHSKHVSTSGLPSRLACLVCATDHLLPHRRRSSLCCKSATAQNPQSRSWIDLLLNSLFFAFSSLTRLARIDAYSFWQQPISHTSQEDCAHIDVEKCRQDLRRHP